MIIKGNEKLSLYGIGPFFAWPSLLLTVISSVIFGFIIDFGKVERLRIPFIILGVVFIAIAAFMYFNAVFKVKIMDCIRNDKLLTEGIYAYVRNPIYSAVLFLCTGIVLIAGNYCLLIIPVLIWLYLTVLVKSTEEIWMTDFYGEEYLEYCSHTNRCIPFFKRKAGKKKVAIHQKKTEKEE